jgi:hypothetical protein
LPVLVVCTLNNIGLVKVLSWYFCCGDGLLKIKHMMCFCIGRQWWVIVVLVVLLLMLCTSIAVATTFDAPSSCVHRR